MNEYGEDIDNSARQREVFSDEAFCRIRRGQLVKNEIVLSDISQCPHISRAQLIHSTIQRKDKTFLVQ